MKKKYPGYIALLVTLLLSFTIQSQNWIWAKTFNMPLAMPMGIQNSKGANGSLYVSAYHWDQNYGQPAGSAIVKFDQSGNLMWTKVFSEPLRIYRLQNDAQGNILLTGDFTGTVVIGGNTFVSQNLSDGFIMKLDAEGNFQWFKHIKGPGEECVYDVFIHSSGQLYLTGKFTNMTSVENTTLTTIGEYCTFLLKCTSAGTVSQLFTLSTTDSGAYNSGQRIQVDDNGDIYLCGSYNQVKADTHSISHYDPYHSQFFARFGASGEVKFLKHLINFNEVLNSMLVASDGIYFTGDGSWTTSAWKITRKYDLDGNELWNKEQSGFYFGFANNKITNNETGFYTVGYETDPQVPQWVSSHSLTINSFDTQGNETCNKLHCKGQGDFRDIVKTNHYEYAVTGLTPDTIQLGAYTLNKAHGTFLIAKFTNGNITSRRENASMPGEFLILPNPGTGQYTLKLPEKFGQGKLSVFNALGTCIKTSDCNSTEEAINISDQPKGVYLVEIKNNEKRLSKMIVLQ